MRSSYLITDYENQNFTVAQTRFDEGAAADIVPIPWNATAGNLHKGGLSTRAKIGIGVSIPSFALLVIIAALLVLRNISRKRRIEQHAAQSNEQRPEPDPPEIKALASFYMQEIGRNSTHEEPRELHDMFQVELLNGQSPSGSGNTLNELPGWSLNSSRTTMSRSPASSTRLNPPSTNTSQTSFSNRSSRNSRTWRVTKASTKTPSNGSSSSSLTLNLSKALPKLPPGNLEQPRSISIFPLHSTKGRRPIRGTALGWSSPSPRHSLREPPSTPISNSPQISPVMGLFQGKPLVRRESQRGWARRMPPRTPVTSTYAASIYDLYKETMVVSEEEVRMI